MIRKEEFEILRGEQIPVYSGDPMDIPCVETSDSERLCKHPVVSVHMVTYNHEHCIRQAIDGVMMQQTDFEFELVIGEDCSTDKTREICFEYQRRYPDKIRVLWCDHNLYRNPHQAGGNWERNIAHCRGEFIAICEGDDYWTDQLKLQKQVEIFRHNPSVGICFCGANRTVPDSEEIANAWNGSAYCRGLIKGHEAFLTHCFGHRYNGSSGDAEFLMTATVMLRATIWEKARATYEIFNWQLCLADTTTWLGAMALSDAYYLPDVVAVYRRTHSGALLGNQHRVMRDAALIRAYYSMKYLGLGMDKMLEYWGYALMAGFINYAKDSTATTQRTLAHVIPDKDMSRKLFRHGGRQVLKLLLTFGILNRYTAAFLLRLGLQMPLKSYSRVDTHASQTLGSI